MCLVQQKRRSVVPINTCKPWNPVVIKKIEPYKFPRQENFTPYLYSKNWQLKKQIPKIIVKNSVQANKPLLFSKMY
jgi:hypothetical protein